VPRWKASGAATNAPEFLSVKGPPSVLSISPDQGGAAVQAFELDRSIGAAAEAIAESMIEGNKSAASTAADYVLMNAAAAPHSLVQLARSFKLGRTDHVLPMADTVPTTRQLLKISPRNPMLWSDMAMHYATLGNKLRAEKCMRAALQLAPDHRWMLRTAARFFVHQEDAGQAHRLLANHPRTPNDPWLIAAELSCAQVAQRAPKYWKLANEIIRFDRYPARHMSELATAVGMMELEIGERKKARKLVAKGLVAPTENTLAQVFWAKERKHLGDSDDLDALIGCSADAYEADYKLKLRLGDLHGALAAAKTWTQDEPFAARPRYEIAYIAALLDDHATTLRMATEVIRVDGKLEENLELNRIFAVLSSGDLVLGKNTDEIVRIEQRLKHLIERASGAAYHATANLALWHYRYGLPETGKVLYRVAIDAARKVHEPEAAAQAANFAAREALLSRDPTAELELAAARDLVEHSHSNSCSFYLRKLEALAREPDRAAELLSPSSAYKFLQIKPELHFHAPRPQLTAKQPIHRD